MSKAKGLAVAAVASVLGIVAIGGVAMASTSDNGRSCAVASAKTTGEPAQPTGEPAQPTGVPAQPTGEPAQPTQPTCGVATPAK